MSLFSLLNKLCYILCLLEFSRIAATSYDGAGILISPVTAVVVAIALEVFAHALFVVALNFVLTTLQ